MNMVVYEERLFSRWLTLILGVISLLMLWQVTQQVRGLNQADDAPLWLYVVMLAVFVALTVNFAWLTIRMTDEEIVVSYGIIRHRLLWRDVTDCRLDDASAMKYGGWGIRRGWHDGKRRLVYSTLGDARVVLVTTDASDPEFVFSTAYPDDVVSRVQEHLRTRKR